MLKKINLIVGIILLGMSVSAQEVLTKGEAVTITLENNYDIRVIKNNVAIAKNNKSIYNSGYLPAVTGNAGANYSNKDTDSEFQDGTINSVTSVTTKAYSASLGLNYTIFDGFNRRNAYKRLKESYSLTEIQAREVIENTLITLFKAYYEVGRLTENEINQKQTLEISKQRLKRANYSFEYGQNTKLDVLNAEVDVNNDSITYLDVNRQLTNAKRDLNVVLGREVNTKVNVRMDVSYALDLTLEDLLQKSAANNAVLLQTKKNIELGQFDVKMNKAGWMPNVGLTSSYAWNKSNNDPINQFTPISSTQTGINAGLNLSWNIFDGGRTKTNVQNAKITLENQEIVKAQQEEFLKRDVHNSWENYQNLLFTLQVQEANVITTKRNFERTNERYKLGQVSSIDFRQAQLNLINSELSLNQAKYTAKNAELQLLSLAGVLLDNKDF